MLNRSLICGRLFSSQAQCLYTVLGVDQHADLHQIKKAFYDRARHLHPDSATTTENLDKSHYHKQFIQLVHAYKTLSIPSKRSQYDLTITQQQQQQHTAMHSPFATPPPSSSSSSPLPTSPSHLTSILNERYATGLAGLFQNRHQHQPTNDNTNSNDNTTTSTITAAASKALDSIKSELEDDLKEALFQIALGPNIDHIQHGQFPDAFEAEERCSSDASDDVLHIVSGRILLGAVREKKGLLEWDGKGEQVQLQMCGDIKAIEMSDAREGDKEEEREREDAPSPDHHHHHADNSSSNGGIEDIDIKSNSGRVLHLMMNYIDKPKATASISPSSSSSSPVTIYDDQGNHWVSTQQPSTSSSTHTYNPISSATKIINANNQHTHTMMYTKTPFVRTLTFISEHYNNNNNNNNQASIKRSIPYKNRVVCRCTRATLPPSSMWLFTPRSPLHNVGGWYVEGVWGHPASLDPEVVVLMAAVETVKNEDKGEGDGGDGGVSKDRGDGSIMSRLMRSIIV